MTTSCYSRLFSCTILLFTLCTTSCSLFKDKTAVPASMYGDIEGVVKENGTNTPIAGAAVSIVTTVKQSTDTDAKGIYSFLRLDPGEYTIQVTHPSYEPKSLKATVTAGEKTPGTILLEPKKSILEINPVTLDFANGENSKTIILKNGYGVGSVSFSAKPNDAWISISPTTGTLKNKESFPVVITVNRKILPVGDYTGSITFNADNNSFQYNITVVIPNPNAPSVVTKIPTNITQTSAEVGGEVTSVGSGNITDFGHRWSENPNPTISDSRTRFGAGGIGPFNSSITDLKTGRKYYVRAYATNSSGTGYGDVFAFDAAITPTPPAVIMTGGATEITSVSAKVTSRITNNGGLAITQNGHVWSTSPNPTITNPANPRTSRVPVTAVNTDFISQLTNLKSGTKYYVRGYAVNSVGVGYTSEDVVVEDRNDYEKDLAKTECENGGYSFGKYCFKNSFNESLLLYRYDYSYGYNSEINMLVAPGATVCTPLLNLYSYPFLEVKYYFKTVGDSPKTGILTLNVTKCKSSFMNLSPDSFYIK